MRTWAFGRELRNVFFIILGFAVVFGVYFIHHGYMSTHSRMNADEGFYALAAQRVMQGELPYRDFGYTQMPFLPYMNGLAMSIAGFGLTSQRICNILWTALGLLMLVLALRRRIGRFEPALAAVFMAASSPFSAELTAMGASHGVTTCFTSLAAAAVIWNGPMLPRIIALAVFGTISVGCRLTMGPVMVALTFALFLEAKTSRDRLLCFAIPIAIGLAGLAPFFIAAPESFFFCNWEYHMGSSFDRRRVEGQPTEWWKAGAAGIVMLCIGLSGSLHLIKRQRFFELFLLLAGLLGLTLPMLPKSGYGWYIIPAVPMAAAAGMVAVWSTNEGRHWPFRHFLWLLPTLYFFWPLPAEVASGKATTPTAMATWAKDAILRRDAVRKPSERTAGSVEEVAAYLRTKVPPGPVLTSLPIVAVEAGRKVWPGTHMGMFAAMNPGQDDKAQRIGFTTIALLTTAVASRKPAAIVKLVGSSVWNFRWRVPSLQRQPDTLYSAYEKAIADNYSVAFKSGNLELLVPKIE
ncbi:MAG: glycosyltransferase family 39 protein [Myxococcota bacterium]|jgi:hypothetical protein|nr:glycosyltransferase family 39 protein [Myxococcota bacterium]